MTSIVILTCGNLALNRRCIESIRTYTTPDTYELIVVDNASSDGTRKWLTSQSDIKLVENEKNIGFPSGCNQGITAAAPGNDILLLNNDTVTTPRWLENLSGALHSSPSIGAVGAVSNSCSYYQSVPVKYQTQEEMLVFADNYNQPDPSVWENRLMLVGFCMLIKAEVVEKIGLMDERFTPGLFEDHDYSFRIRKAGYRLVLCKDTFIHHEGSATFRAKQDLPNNLARVNAKKFTEKWGFDPLYFTAVRSELASFLVQEHKDATFNLLEIGCACGGLLLHIKNRYPRSSLSGIEMNISAARTISEWAEIREGDTEDPTVLSYSPNSFDYVLLADILEHLRDPWITLKRVFRLLKPGGAVVASIPNIMHFTIVRNLLHGIWEYTDCGILDRSHLRFFTLRQIQKMFAEAGFNELETRRTLVQRKDGDAAFIKSLCSLSGMEMEPLFETFQFVIKAFKPRETGINQ